jgi:beta-lactamase family protein
MVVRTSVSGVRGRHSAAGPRPPRAPIRVVLAVLGACVAGTLAGLAAAGAGTHGGTQPGARSVPAGAAGRPSSAGQLSVTASAPSPRPRSMRAPRATSPAASAAAGAIAGAAGGGDPFGTAAASYLPGREGAVLAAVYDLGSGRTWRIGRGQPQAEASVVKLDILETLLAERDRSPGLSAADRALAARMIEDSDNDAATSLWHEVGGAARIRSFNTRAGLTRTVPSSCVACPGFAWPGWGLTTTTPDDQIALLRQLVTPGSLLTPAARGYALSLLENVIPAQRWGVCAGVPAGVTVALKNGWLPLRGADGDWQVNSVGWVSGDGRDYLMAVLSTGNPSVQYGIDTIGQLASMVWQQMG